MASTKATIIPWQPPRPITAAFTPPDSFKTAKTTWLASNPNKIVADNFKIPDAQAAKFPDHRVFIAPKSGG